MPDRSDPANPPPAPRPARQSVFLMAGVERFDSPAKTRHRVRDLSAGGMKIDNAGTMRPGATILVAVGSLEAVGATVMWVEDGTAGIRFATAIDPERARDRAALPQTRASEPDRKAPAAPPEPPAGGPTAGWLHDVRNPYRR